MIEPCVICRCDTGILVDVHADTYQKNKGCHNIHSECLLAWERTLNHSVRVCPYCTLPVRPDFDVCISKEREVLIQRLIAAIRRNIFEEFKTLLRDQTILDDYSIKHLLMTEATIHHRYIFLELINEISPINTYRLAPFLAIGLSMKSKGTLSWYLKLFKARRRFSSRINVPYLFQNQLLLAASVLGKKRLIFYYRLKTHFHRFIPGESQDVCWAVTLGCPKFILDDLNARTIITCKDFNDLVIPYIVKKKNTRLIRYWLNYPINLSYTSYRNSETIMKTSVEEVDYAGCYHASKASIFMNKNRPADLFIFGSVNVDHLFGWRGVSEGEAILRLLAYKNLLDIEDLRRNKIKLCRLSHEAMNYSIIEALLQILGECLTGVEMVKIVNRLENDN